MPDYEEIVNELKKNNDYQIEYKIEDINYKIIIFAPNGNIHIPSILAIPLTENMNNQFVVESNNYPSDIAGILLQQAKDTIADLVNETSDYPTPIIVPIIPDHRDAYYQQLSLECFEVDESVKEYRIDNQIVEIINKAKKVLSNEYGIEMQDKIFLNGYSSSGVFAQRFSLLHPELIDTACIGGASGSIPLPIEELSYPLGIKDYEKITGKKFDMDSYSKIKFRYYVGEYETSAKSEDRKDEEGNYAPMHDMSYFDKSIPIKLGNLQRQLLGKNLFDRANKTINILKEMGIDVEHQIILGRSHNNRSGHGVNELGAKFIHDCYIKSVKKTAKNNY